MSDEETFRIIEENPYMQYFLGLDEFAPAPLFFPTLFVEWRKKFDNETFNEFSEVLFKISFGDRIVGEGEKHIGNEGKLELDATVADQNVTYPNNLGQLNKAREKTEKIIDLLFDKVRDQIKIKPRTYRKMARKKYLAESKKRQVNKKTLRSAIRYHLNCPDRNIKSIDGLLDVAGEGAIPNRSRRDLWIVRTLNIQQRKMYNEKSHSCPDRIVSISQPYVRPIVRGKNGKK